MINIKNRVKQILFDADDTLWENNIYYLEANRDFFALITENGFEKEEIVKDFDNLEMKVIRKRGYGSINYVYILEELFKKYNNHSKSKLDYGRLQEIKKRFLEHPLQKPLIFKDVVKTLNYLRGKYNLFILTKGDQEEQSGKIVHSELDKLVDDYFVVPEKNDREYRRILEKFSWKAHETCMVGNSPKSDINPALRSGMYAIHIPYRDTWKVDIEPIISHNGYFTILKSFSELITVL